MLNLSTEYTDLLKSQYRPKCEPRISVYDNDNVVASWEASNIVDLNLTRGIDPLGRTLPYINLEWTEICTDKLTIDGSVSKYANIKPLMTVRIEFIQNLSLTSSWKNLYESGTSWKKLYENETTWKDVYENTPKEIIKFPTLFLSSTPIIENNTIKWSAKDFFSFLTTTQNIGFRSSGVTYTNVLRRILLEERANYKGNKDFVGAIENTSIGIKQDTISTSNYQCIFEIETNNILKNMLASKNAYFNIKNTPKQFVDDYGNPIKFETYAKYERLSELLYETTEDGSTKNPLYIYTSDFIKELPQITKNSNVSTSNFKRYRVVENKKEQFTVTETRREKVGDTSYYVEFDLDKMGYISSITPTDQATWYAKNISNCVSAFTSSEKELTATIIPCEKAEYPDFFTNYNQVGEAYDEDNDCCFGMNGTQLSARTDYIFDYFNQNTSSIEFECLPNLALELGDLIAVETNLYNEETDKRIFKQGFLVEQEISYNGAISQKNTIHDVNRNFVVEYTNSEGG